MKIVGMHDCLLFERSLSGKNLVNMLDISTFSKSL